MHSMFSPKRSFVSGIVAVAVLAGCTPSTTNTSMSDMQMQSSTPMMNSEMCTKCEGMDHNSMGMQNHSAASRANSGMASSMNHNAHTATASPNIYAPAMTKMHTSMQMGSSGNSDVDFMRGVIPHHQGAIDMARIALANSSDPVVRKLATEIVEAQKTEISLMQRWLTTHETNR